MADATRRVAKRAVAKKATARKATPAAAPAAENPWEDLLDAGDRFEFGATVEVTDKRGRKYWPKAGVTVALRPGETPTQAKDRAATFVHEVLDEQAKQFLS